MTPTKLLIGQIIVVFAIVLLGIWAATQWAAAMLAYQPELGAPWFRLDGVPVYHPWALFPWWYHYDAYAPHVFDRAGMFAGASGFIGCAAAIFGSLWRARQSSNVTTYGSARWANAREIERAGLHRDAGVMLGTLRRRYLRHDGPEHVMAFAPTRSGKGVGLVVPTLLSWTGSAVIHDIKGENWTLTAGWRARFSHCLLFNPTDAASAHYNPLLEVRRGVNEVRDVQNIADILVDPTNDPNAQGRKEAFVGSLDPRGDVNPHVLTPSPSPYTLSAGSVISASLITGLRSDLPGLVTAQVTENTFDSATGRILLIPQGARLIGSYDSVVAFGQSRALIVWQRIVMPDGSSLRIDNVPAADPSGYAGLQDKVDYHTWTLLKGVAISTLLGVGANLTFTGEGDLVQAIRESTQANVSRAGDQITSRNLAVQPTITIRPGAPVRLIVHRDLILAPWKQ